MAAVMDTGEACLERAVPVVSPRNRTLRRSPIGGIRRLYNDRIWRPWKGFASVNGTWRYVGAGALAASLLGAAVISGGGLTLHDRNAARVMGAQLVPSSRVSHLGWKEPDPTTTTTSAPSPTQPPVRTPVSRSVSPVRAPASTGDDFWHRLAGCENPLGGNRGGFVGYFQFSYDTAAKLGITGNESYEAQKAAAQRWATMVNPGSRSGWPICWWKAQ